MRACVYLEEAAYIMTIQARYLHTNLIARDWQRLSIFSQEVFSCWPVPPERHFAGHDLERGTGVSGSELHGVHLSLPGFKGDGPTLEIFTYSLLQERSTLHAVNEPGFGHIAFAVADVPKAREVVLAAGGAAVGEVVTLQLASGAQVTWCYVRDPEGNIIELQSLRPAITG
jgi:catechol 2,3-dioxygenase-like lactoylglutathione lyase family enzyme